MNSLNKVKSMTIAALLCAVGIMIPMFFPKIIIGPASFTLASHVPILIAMFISPTVAISVALITGFGFLFAGFPLIIVFRALTHLVFAGVGSFMLKKNNQFLLTFRSASLYALLISVIHAVAEVIVVSYFFFTNPEDYTQSYFYIVLVMVGAGTLIHSLIDFMIAVFVWKPLQHVISIPANAKIKLR